LQCVAVRCSVLQCVGSTTTPSARNADATGVLQLVAVRGSAWHCVAVCGLDTDDQRHSPHRLQRSATGVLQCVAVCVAVCCSVWPQRRHPLRCPQRRHNRQTFPKVSCNMILLSTLSGEQTFEYIFLCAYSALRGVSE